MLFDLEGNNLSAERSKQSTESFLKEIRWQLSQAKRIQKSILPDKLPDWNCINCAARYIALDDVGGDYYDLFPIKGDKIGLLIADVSGHGIPAALVTSMAKVSFSFFARQYDSPKEILKNVNDELIRYLPQIGAYLTCFMLVIDKQLNVKYSNAGHQHAIMYINEKNTFEYLDTDGLFIGAFEDAADSYEEKSTKLSAGDRIILYTDGIVETKNPEHEEYGYQRFEDMVTFSSALSNEKLAELVIDDITQFAAGEPIKDDVSILILEVELKFQKYLESLEKVKQLEKNGDVEGWLAEAENLMNINPDDLYVKYGMAKLFYETKKMPEAQKLLQDYLSRNTENYLVYYLLGNIHYLNHEIEQAITAYSHCLKLNPFFSYGYNNMAAALVKNGEIEKASSLVMQANSLDPNNQKINQNLARFKDTVF